MPEDGQEQNPTSQSPSIPRDDAIPRRPTPPNIRIAFLLWIAFSIILIVLLIIIWGAPEPPSNRPQIPEEWRNNPAQREADALRATGAFIALLLQICIPAGMAVIAYRMRAGSHRARIALAVLGAVLALLIVVIIVANLSSVSAPIGAYFMVRLLINLVLLALLTAAISLMFSPRVSGFFR